MIKHGRVMVNNGMRESQSQGKKSESHDEKCESHDKT